MQLLSRDGETLDRSGRRARSRLRRHPKRGGAAVTTLHAPVKSALRKTTTSASVERMWHRIDARQRTRPAKSSGRGLLLAVAATLPVALAIVLVSRMALHPSFQAPAGPVLQASGDVFEAVRIARGERLVLLNDGTRIRLTA